MPSLPLRDERCSRPPWTSWCMALAFVHRTAQLTCSYMRMWNALGSAAIEMPCGECRAEHIVLGTVWLPTLKDYWCRTFCFAQTVWGLQDMTSMPCNT